MDFKNINNYLNFNNSSDSNDNINKPKLIEPGVKYFFKGILKECHNYKQKNYNLVYNISLFILFFSILGIILFYRYKGNKTSHPNRAPGIFIHPDKNSLRIYMNTLENILEYVDIDNIPIKRWVHMAIVLNGKHLDIYINGYLKTRHLLNGTPKQNFGDLYLNMFGGFEGYMCRMRYHRRALKYNEIESQVKKGPSKEACSDSGSPPPYLDDNWWFDK